MKLRLLPFSLILSLIICSIEIDISVPSFPDMAKYFAVSKGQIQLTIVFNFLGFCCASLLYGPLSDRYGRRPLMLLGNTFLLIGSLGCFLSSSLPSLLWARFIQGIGAAAVPVLVFAIISEIYSSSKALKLISLMNAVLTLLMALAPLFGSFLLQQGGWRWIYGFVAILSALTWLSLCLFLPETYKPLKKRDIFFKGYLQMLQDGQFLRPVCTPSLLYATYLAFISCSPFLYREHFKLSALEYGGHQSFIMMVFSLLSLQVDRIILKIGNLAVIKLGLLAVIGGGGFLGMISFFKPTPFLVTSSMSLFVAGFALLYPPIFNKSLDFFQEMRGAVSSFIMTLRAFIIALCVGVTSGVYQGELKNLTLALLFIMGVILMLTWSHLKLFKEREKHRKHS